LIVLKALVGLAAPPAAIGVWTSQCYQKSLGSKVTWSVGPGILIVSIAFEIASLYGIRCAIPDEEEDEAGAKNVKDSRKSLIAHEH
jgi:hypothetical protein